MSRERLGGMREARESLRRADEFLMAARQLHALGLCNAAAANAAVAGVHAADALCLARLGRHATGPNHEQALALLERAGTQGKAARAKLARLLPWKHRGQYDLVTDATAKQAGDAVRWAEALVGLAHDVTVSPPASRP